MIYNKTIECSETGMLTLCHPRKYIKHGVRQAVIIGNKVIRIHEDAPDEFATCLWTPRGPRITSEILRRAGFRDGDNVGISVDDNGYSYIYSSDLYGNYDSAAIDDRESFDVLSDRDLFTSVLDELLEDLTPLDFGDGSSSMSKSHKTALDPLDADSDSTETVPKYMEAVQEAVETNSALHYCDKCVDVDNCTARDHYVLTDITKNRVFVPYFQNDTYILVIYHNRDKKSWIELRKASEYDVRRYLHDVTGLLNKNGKMKLTEADDGLCIITQVSERRVSAFNGFAGENTLDAFYSVDLPMWYADNDTVVVEGYISKCKICGKDLRTTDQHTIATVCRDCA